MHHLLEPWKKISVVFVVTLVIGCSPQQDVTESPDPQADDQVLAIDDAKSSHEESPSTIASSDVPKFYTVNHYDEAQDPAADLASTMQRAHAENKRILLQVGGEWCVWCARITKYMETNATIRGLLEQNYLVMKVTYPAANAESFLENYPDVPAYPHFFVLDSDGNLLHAQGTGELETGDSYDESVFSKFLSDWTPQAGS